VIAALFAALLWQGAAEPPALPPATAAAPLVLRAGTVVRFATEGPIDSRSVSQGQRFGIVVAEDVRIGDLLLLPRGTRAVGEVEAMTERGVFGKAGSLALQPLFVNHGGQRIYFEGLSHQQGKNQVGGAAAATFLLGGLGLMITGKNVQVPAGSPMIGTVRSDVSISR